MIVRVTKDDGDMGKMMMIVDVVKDDGIGDDGEDMKLYTDTLPCG